MSLHYVNKYLEAELKARGLYSEELIGKIVEEGSLRDIPGIPSDLKRVYVTAMDIAAEDHIRMQAAFQKHVDNSITKTCNFPNDATHEDIRQAYVLGWKLRCKGLTVYRDGSRDVQILNLNKKKEKQTTQAPAPAASVRAPQPVAVPIPMTVTATPVMPVAQPVYTAPRVATPTHSHQGGVAVSMAPAATPVRERLAEVVAHSTAQEKIRAGICPECDTELQLSEGCKSCPGCGWALCSL